MNSIGIGKSSLMARSKTVQEAFSNYLSGNWNLDQIEAWAVEFGDEIEQREDSWSMEMSGQVLEWLREMGHGFRTVEEFNAALRDLLVTSAVAD